MEATFSVNSCTTRSSSDHWKSPAFDGAQLRPLDKVAEYLAVIVGVLFVGKHQPAMLASLRPSGFVFGGALLGSIARGILGSRATVLVIIIVTTSPVGLWPSPIDRSNAPTIPTVGPVLIPTVGSLASIVQHTYESLQTICVCRKGFYLAKFKASKCFIENSCLYTDVTELNL